MAKNFNQDAKLFKAFCDENRLKIIEMLNSGEKCACILLEELEISQPTLSHHMKILVESGVITGRKEGKWMHYSIHEGAASRVKEHLNSYIKINAKGNRENEEDICN